MTNSPLQTTWMPVYFIWQWWLFDLLVFDDNFIDYLVKYLIGYLIDYSCKNCFDYLWSWLFHLTQASKSIWLFDDYLMITMIMIILAQLLVFWLFDDCLVIILAQLLWLFDEYLFSIIRGYSRLIGGYSFSIIRDYLMIIWWLFVFLCDICWLLILNYSWLFNFHRDASIR